MNTTYLTRQGSLQTFIRADVGATVNQGYRYGIDVFDRVWTPYNFGNWNLSATGLTGEILELISDLTSLEVLDLSNNSLTGSVPEFLANMETLKLINLSGNELNGSIPATLLDKERRGSITLSIEGNAGLCSSASCATTKKKKKNTVIAPVAASLVSVFLIGAGIVTFLILKRKKRSKLGLNPNSGTDHNILKEYLLCKVSPELSGRIQKLLYF
ncbi:hypothetical protein ARALYDRAFT_337336 [Arabidopsis lyrata subsp. lyrata]|uniref:Malectin-like domain-containing protein n=1 Tax=Arabidopsis lyrata subsp. lyrata TaxID=81972 RepID=D7KIK5_ARALL|nr:hypothetical protein ARALYDRAFT_337336 [Arabidopsis lyrata subsp. lyrata]